MKMIKVTLQCYFTNPSRRWNKRTDQNLEKFWIFMYNNLTGHYKCLYGRRSRMNAKVNSIPSCIEYTITILGFNQPGMILV